MFLHSENNGKYIRNHVNVILPMYINIIFIPMGVPREKPEGNGPLDERATMHGNELKSQNLISDLKSETSITLMCMLP